MSRNYSAGALPFGLIVCCFMGYYAYGAMISQAPMNSLSSPKIEDEIGERTIVRVKQRIKEPLLTLLASSEFTSKKEFRRRLDEAVNTLIQFKSEIEPGLQQPIAVGPLPAAASAPQAPIVVQPVTPPAPAALGMPSATPVPAVAAAPKPASAPAPITMPTASAAPAPIDLGMSAGDMSGGMSAGSMDMPTEAGTDMSMAAPIDMGMSMEAPASTPATPVMPAPAAIPSAMPTAAPMGGMPQA